MINQPGPATVGSNGLQVAFVATYVPRQCGIATFTHDLVEAVRAAPQDIRPRVIAMDRGEGLSYPPAVAATLAVSDRAAYRSLGRCLADDGVQLISLQHEYGIFGGRSGEYVKELLENSPIPVVSTLHTLLTRPTRTQELILRCIAEQSARLVTMSQRGRAILVERYGADPARIAVIPHGVPSFDRVDRRAARTALGLDHATVVLSAGLLGPHKNVELVLEALARIADRVPHAVYAVVGTTHPELRKRFGEAYRRGLEDRVRSLGLDGRVRFVDRYLSRDELMTWLAAGDVFVTPYRNAQQIASGTLAYAMAAGCVVVSTPYAHALELLDQGRGLLVPFDDADALSDALRRLLTDDQERERIGRRAHAHCRTMTWPAVAAQYAAVFSAVRSERAVERRAVMRRLVAVPIDGSGRRPHGALRPVDAVPPPARRHLEQIRDRVGVIQFAVGHTPDRRDGYCTDDVARALRVDLRHQAHEPGAATAAAIWVDLRFLAEALDPDTGRFRNLRTAAGRWPETIGSEDAHGRAIQALGEAVSSPDRAVAAEARGLLANALPAAARLEWARPQAYSILGCAAALDDARSSQGVRHVLVTLLDRLEQGVSRARSLDPQWPWPEERCTYDNGVIAEALITGGLNLERPATVRLGLDVLRWLFDAETGPDGRLRPIGNDGWWEPGRDPARWAEQPIEPASLLSAAVAAHGATGDDSWGRLAERAYAWFLGANELGLEVADPERGACHDGLGPGGLNANQGAESTLAWLMRVERMRDLAEIRSSTRHGAGRGQDRTYSITSDKRAVARATVESAAP
ncbi:MAG: glycosyltransferase [Chloroflexi bacterium]|nr:glycosyltransferase [Chloroflexota bacterium]